ncbi:hypothetical protein EBN03_22475 [Nocardia stercoris]|uniref:Uncharacterized protein n=1 Tax=Nocardia stercoris TaxID=2483361 RepID=A0A3M2KZ57_9NOCA|nr:hypothetical protein EBN03_22475 [Nocardia stercoris]
MPGQCSFPVAGAGGLSGRLGGEANMICRHQAASGLGSGHTTSGVTARRTLLRFCMTTCDSIDSAELPRVFDYPGTGDTLI